MNRTLRNILIVLFFTLNLTVFAFSISKFISRNITEDSVDLQEEAVSVEYLIDNNEVEYAKSEDDLINITFKNQTINLGPSFSASIFGNFDEIFENGKPKDEKCRISKITISRNTEMGTTFQERILIWDYCLENV